MNDVSFEVEAGQICSLIGPNGAGKTTLFNLISAVFRPSAGRILFEGRDLTRLPTHALARLGIARTFQNLAVFKHETVVDNILVGMHTRLRADAISAAIFLGRARAEEIRARERVEEIIEFLEIEDIRDQPVGTLSYGLQKRVELGRALAVSPKLLLLDEMVSGHEPGGARGHRALHSRPEGRTRHDRVHGRARHGHRDGHFRPCLRDQRRPQDRRRPAGARSRPNAAVVAAYLGAKRAAA